MVSFWLSWTRTASNLSIHVISFLLPQIPEAYTNRSPELDFVIAKHEAPTVRLPARLPSKPTGESFCFYLLFVCLFTD